MIGIEQLHVKCGVHFRQSLPIVISRNLDCQAEDVAAALFDAVANPLLALESWRAIGIEVDGPTSNQIGRMAAQGREIEVESAAIALLQPKLDEISGMYGGFDLHKVRSVFRDHRPVDVVTYVRNRLGVPRPVACLIAFRLIGSPTSNLKYVSRILGIDSEKLRAGVDRIVELTGTSDSLSTLKLVDADIAGRTFFDLQKEWVDRVDRKKYRTPRRRFLRVWGGLWSVPLSFLGAYWLVDSGPGIDRFWALILILLVIGTIFAGLMAVGWLLSLLRSDNPEDATPIGDRDYELDEDIGRLRNLASGLGGHMEGTSDSILTDENHRH